MQPFETKKKKTFYPNNQSTKTFKKRKLSYNDGPRLRPTLRERRTVGPDARGRIVALHGANRGLGAVERSRVRLQTADDVQNAVDGRRRRA